MPAGPSSRGSPPSPTVYDTSLEHSGQGIGRLTPRCQPHWANGQLARDAHHAPRRTQVRPGEIGQTRDAEPARAALQDSTREVGARYQRIGLADGPSFVATSRECGDEIQPVVDIGQVLVPGVQQSRQGGHEGEGVPEPSARHAPLGALGLGLLEEALDATDRPITRLAERGARPYPAVFRLGRRRPRAEQNETLGMTFDEGAHLADVGEERVLLAYVVIGRK